MSYVFIYLYTKHSNAILSNHRYNLIESLSLNVQYWNKFPTIDDGSTKSYYHYVYKEVLLCILVLGDYNMTRLWWRLWILYSYYFFPGVLIYHENGGMSDTLSLFIHLYFHHQTLMSSILHALVLILFNTASFSLYFFGLGLVLRDVLQQGHLDSAHLMKISHVWQRFWPWS